MLGLFNIKQDDYHYHQISTIFFSKNIFQIEFRNHVLLFSITVKVIYEQLDISACLICIYGHKNKQMWPHFVFSHLFYGIINNSWCNHSVAHK